MSEKQTDIKKLIQNFKDLNYVTQKVKSSVDDKNKIIESGIKDCDECKKKLKNN